MTERDDDQLMRAARRLSTDISPEHDLWPGIAASIAKPATRQWTPTLAQAAAVVLLIGASSAVTYVTMKDKRPMSVIASPELVFEQASFGGRYYLGSGYQDARNGLVADLNIELGRLSAGTRATIETNLQVIRVAIFELNKALEEEPDNAHRQAQLLRSYREELMLLRRVSRLSRNVMMRNDI